jgi:hypothetical protein
LSELSVLVINALKLNSLSIIMQAFLWTLDCDRVLGQREYNSDSETDEVSYTYPNDVDLEENRTEDEKNDSYQWPAEEERPDYWMGTREEWLAEGFDITKQEDRDRITYYNGYGWPGNKLPDHLEEWRQRNIEKREEEERLLLEKEEERLRAQFPKFYSDLEKLKKMDPADYTNLLSRREFTSCKYEQAQRLAENLLVQNQQSASDPFVQWVGEVYRYSANTILVYYLVRSPDGELSYPKFFTKINPRYDYGVDLDQKLKENAVLQQKMKSMTMEEAFESFDERYCPFNPEVLGTWGSADNC